MNQYGGKYRFKYKRLVWATLITLVVNALGHSGSKGLNFLSYTAGTWHIEVTFKLRGSNI